MNQNEDAKSSSLQIKIVWKNVIIMVLLHFFGISGIFMCDSLKHFVYVLTVSHIYILGITAGVHRLWSHKTYRAKLPLRIFLMLMNSGMMQDNIYSWSRDHRVHHKFTDTDADPFNSTRGFFFCHMGWLMMKKHPAIIEKGKNIDVSDVLADPVVKFQMKYYVPLAVLMGIIVPCLIPYFLWDIGLYKCFCLFFCFRYLYCLHVVWMVNSVAHMWGYKPYDPTICPVENVIVSFLVNGEGFHNYHHTFPWDYSTSEFGWNVNISTMFIDFMGWIGLAYDMRKVPEELVEKFKNKYKSTPH